MKTTLLLLALAFPAQASEVLPSGFTRGANGDLVIGGTVTVTQLLAMSGGNTMTLSAGGFDTTGTVVFSSNIVILGDMEVRSSKQKAIYLPNGGIHLTEAVNPTVAPGQMFSKNIKTSTLTFVGSALFFQNAQGVNTSTMTGTALAIADITVTTVTATSVSGKVRNTNSGGGVPDVTGCDDASEHGTMYMSSSPGRLYICEFPGSGWRYSTLSP